MSSQQHINALIKLLTGPTIPPSTTLEEVVNLVGSLTSTRTLSFSKEEIPRIRSNHNHALNISVEVMGKAVPLSLVDNRSALNVCPVRTFKCLGLKESDLAPTSAVVRAYDNTRREVMGSIKLAIGVGPINPDVEFQVIDIPAYFNLLLGRPWLHNIKGVSSSLHQKLKFFANGRVITILGNNYNAEGVSTNSPIFEIQHGSNDMLLSGFWV